MLSDADPTVDMPVGTILPWNPHASIPPGWRRCDGRPLRRGEYPDLAPQLRAARFRTSRWPWARTTLPDMRDKSGPGVEYIIRVDSRE